MLFTSITFLFYFLPLLIVSYFFVPSRQRNNVLIAFSFIFYAWGGVSYSIILLGSIFVNYLLVKQLQKNYNSKKGWLYVGVLFNILVIVVFKYLDFIISNINHLGFMFKDNFTSLPLQHIVLPLGISFFTFQQTSLLWDVYRDDKAEKVKFSNIALYVSLFPQLIAGPIVRYKDIVNQIKRRSESIALFRSGVQRFILGLFRKVIIANSCGEIADSIMSSSLEHINTPVAWLGIIAYTFQIYFDFAGYSDMAIGLGRMFGFRILENFNFPYISKSIKEFWRRWHISLSSWFKDYVYIPLGGNRSGKYRTYYNLFIVFLLTGLWHGATWSFVFWGLFHGFFLTVEKIGFGKTLLKLPQAFRWIYSILVVTVGWVFFRIEDFPTAIEYAGKLFGIGNSNHAHVFSYLNNERIAILILALLASSKFFLKLQQFINSKAYYNQLVFKYVLDLSILLAFVYSVMYINSGTYNPFIYFRF